MMISVVDHLGAKMAPQPDMRPIQRSDGRNRIASRGSRLRHISCGDQVEVAAQDCIEPTRAPATVHIAHECGWITAVVPDDPMRFARLVEGLQQHRVEPITCNVAERNNTHAHARCRTIALFAIIALEDVQSCLLCNASMCAEPADKQQWQC